jgi:hypothetical protein
MTEFINGIECGFGLSMIVYFIGQGCRIFMTLIETCFGNTKY